MIIKYDKTQYSTVTHEIDIPDTKNVFLRGANSYDGTTTYFGIWSNERFLVIVTISKNTISYEYSVKKSIYTEEDIKKYLRNNRNVESITKERFKEQLNMFNAIVQI